MSTQKRSRNKKGNQISKIVSEVVRQLRLSGEGAKSSEALPLDNIQSVSNTAARFDIVRPNRAQIRAVARSKGDSVVRKGRWAVDRANCMDWLKCQKPNSFQTLILDPPFNIGYQYNEFDDNMPQDEYIQEQVGMLELAYPLLRDGGSVFYINYPSNSADVWAGMRNTAYNRFRYLHWIYRNQIHGIPVRKGTRHVLWLAKGNPLVHREAFQTEYRCKQDKRVMEKMAAGDHPQMHDWFLAHQVSGNSKGKRKYHKCQMPSRPIERAILGTSNPGDLVGDCYLGSGTSAFAALGLGRDFLGCDMDPMYVEKAKELLSAEFGPEGHGSSIVTELPHSDGSVSVSVSNGAPDRSRKIHRRAKHSSGSVESARPTVSSRSVIEITPQDSDGDFEGFVTGKQLMKGNIVEPSPLLKGFFERRGVGLLAGMTGARKSWIGFEIAYSTATGTNCMGLGIPQQGAVLYANFELNRIKMRKRNRLMCKHRGLKEVPQNILFFNQIKNIFELSNPKHAAVLEAKIAEVRPSLMIFDTAKRGMGISGLGDQAVTSIYALLAAWSERYDMYVLIIDHTNAGGTKVFGSYAKMTNPDIVLLATENPGKTTKLYIQKPPSSWDVEPEDRTYIVSVQDGKVLATKATAEDQVQLHAKVSNRARKDALGRQIILGLLDGDKRVVWKVIRAACKKQGVSLHRMRRLLEELATEDKIDFKEQRPEGGLGGNTQVYFLKSIPPTGDDGR